MTDDDPKVARREIADALVRALERRHEFLDVVVEAEDYDAAIDSIATHLGTSTTAAEAVLRLSFDRLTKVARRRIAAELEDLNNQLSFTMGDPARSPDSLVLRPFSADADRDIFAARTADVQEAGDGSRAPAGDLEDEIRAGLRRVDAEDAAWLVATHGPQKIGMIFGDLVSGEVNVRIWIHPDHRKRGFGTAVLRKSRSEMAAYFPAVPLVVRAPAAGS
ncbi:GNAT family N-acetyltransferase [Mycolicibacterium tusciae]|uniref:GNAT family N-acetyltransferase n=1 Tax=Mycolicibacterium tusciae TaxID=75922 RepID=UPI00024A2DC9|nr:GNAT family N-acetyltransferase [Mycolicibacterium tusciae]